MPNTEIQSGIYILLAEDDSDLRASVADLVGALGYNIETVPDGQQAQRKLTEKKYDLILSDYKMPQVNGLDLLRFVKKNYPTPFILTTAFIDLVEAEEAIRIGADGFLPKPFRTEELSRLLHSVLHPKNEEELDAETENIKFCKIPIGDFISSSNLKLDVYIKLSEGKYLRIAKEGYELAGQRIAQYKAKGAEHLYIRQDEFNRYVGLNVNLARAVGKSNKVIPEKKVQALVHSAEVIVQDLYVNGIDPKKFADSKDVLLLTLNVVGQEIDLFTLLASLNKAGDWLYAHSLGVALYAGLIAEELMWTSDLTRGKVLMAGLLHDVGLKEIDPDILHKGRAEWDKNESRIYEGHCARGRDILSRVTSVQEEIALVALEHHENCNGQGYPSKLKKDQISPLAKLISVADTFCELTLKGPSHSVPLSPHDAITRMLYLNKGDFDSSYLGPLFKLLAK